MKKGKFMKRVLTFMFAFLILFVITILIMGFTVQYEPSTLIGAVFAFCSVEGGAAAWIKVIKEKKKGKGEEQ